MKATGRKAFTMVELLVVIVVILLVMGLSIPVIAAFSKSRGLGAAVGIVRGCVTRARAQAIATGNPQYLLFFTGDPAAPGDPAPLSHTVSPVTPNGGLVSPRTFRSGRNTILLVDENARATTANVAAWLVAAGSPESLPENSNFAIHPTRSVIEVQFHPDGTLLLAGDKDSSGFTRTEDQLVTEMKDGTLYDLFDLAIVDTAVSSACVFNLVQNTGTIQSLVFPR